MRAHNHRVADGIQSLCLLLVLLSLCSAISAEEVKLEHRFDFNIPRQAASSALIEFAEQADLTLVFPDELVRDKSTNSLVGRYTRQEGIDALLAGTGLTPRFSNEIVLSISVDDESAPKGEKMNTSQKAGIAVLAATFSVGVAAQDGIDTGEAIEEIAVTGSNIQRSGFTAVSPVQVVDRASMLADGAKTMSDVAINLAINVGSEFQNESGSLIGTAQFNLRGLGLGSTLTLINGRRGGQSAVSDGGGNQFFDINQLPISMIERVDFLTDGASAVYGSQAVAGVANIVTRKGFEGFELMVDGQTSPGPEVDQVQLGFAFGASGDGPTKVNIYGGYLNRNRADRTDFDFINERVLGNGDPTASRTLSTIGSPGSFRRAVTAPVTGVISGTGASMPDPDCEAGGGILLGSFCRYSFADQVSVLPEETRIQLFTEATHEFSDRLSVYGEGSYSSNKISRTQGPFLFRHGLLSNGNRMLIPADHPFNFFVDDGAGGMTYIDPANWDNSIHQAVDLEFRGRPFGAEFNGGNGPDDREIDLAYLRFLGGATADISDTWSIEASYMFARSDRDESRPYNYIASVVNNRLLDGSWNPFGTRLANPGLVSPKDGVSLAANPDEVSNSLHTLNFNSARAEQEVAEVKFIGEFGEMAGGNIGLAAGLQYRNETFGYVPDPLDASGLGNALDSRIDGDQDVDAAFVEVILPVLETLEVQAALRYEDYGKQAGDTTDPKLAVRWQATESFGVRGSWGTSFQSPSVRQTSISRQSQIIDDPASINPVTGLLECVDRDVTSIAVVVNQGDENLKPQSADSFTVGFVAELSRMNVSLDYWSFDYEDLITSDEGAQAILANDCSDGVPDDPRVSRRADGTVLGITSEFINTGSVKTDGADISLDYEMDASGWFDAMRFSFGATYINKFDVKTNSNSASFDGAGSRNFTNQFRSMPEWRGNLGVTWERGSHMVSAQFRYIDSYKNDQPNPESTIGSWTTVDGQYLIRLFDDRSQLSIGVKNLFDEDPPSLGDQVRPGYDNLIHNVLGRMIYATYSQSF